MYNIVKENELMRNKLNIFHNTVILYASIDEVFSFFSKAENLELLTPAWLKFKILTPTPILIKKGCLIDYRIKIFGIPVKWKTEITCWQPPHRFIDEQLKGPYKIWKHEHQFIEHDNQTKMIDRVQYQVPGWFLSPIIHNFFVRKAIKNIFKFRSNVIEKILG